MTWTDVHLENYEMNRCMELTMELKNILGIQIRCGRLPPSGSVIPVRRGNFHGETIPSITHGRGDDFWGETIPSITHGRGDDFWGETIPSITHGRGDNFRGETIPSITHGRGGKYQEVTVAILSSDQLFVRLVQNAMKFGDAAKMELLLAMRMNKPQNVACLMAFRQFHR